MTKSCNHWSHAGEWQKLRTDVNILAWLVAEEKFRKERRGEEVEPWHGKARITAEDPSP